MRYVLAIFLPPFAIFGCGKTGQFIVNLFFWILSLIFWLCGLVMFILLPVLGGIGFFIWLICTFHALIVCSTQDRNKQMDRLVAAIQSRPGSTLPPPVPQQAK